MSGTPVSRLSRRRFLAFSAGIAGSAILAACGGESPTNTPATGAGGATAAPKATTSGSSAAPAGGATPAAAQGTPKKGGILKVAMNADPVIDPMFTTATISSNVGWHLWEGLYTRDAAFNPQPLLAESVNISPDGKSFEFILRKNVTFHNGKTMTSADVVASLKRWFNLAGRGQATAKRLDAITAKDANTVTMTFKEPTGVLPQYLALPEAFIMPEEIANAYSKDRLPEDKLIGTGPFKFVEHQPDRIVRFARFDNYASRTEPSDGAAGKRTVYIDELQLLPVPEDGVRADGIGTGEYHFSDVLRPDQYDTIKSNAGVTPLTVKPYYFYGPVFNKKKGIFADVKMRQAVLMALSMEPIMVAGFGRPEFINLDPAISAKGSTFFSTAGSDVYNKPDPEKAKALMKEAGYTGQPIRWLATKEYFYNYTMALAAKDQLAKVGMPVDLVVTDWATLLKNRANADLYEVFITGWSAYSHPLMQPYLAESWPGFWTNPEKDKLVSDFTAEPDPAKQKAFADQLQALQWKDLPVIKVGDGYSLRAIRNEVKGYVNPADWFFWNIWIEK